MYLSVWTDGNPSDRTGVPCDPTTGNAYFMLWSGSGLIHIHADSSKIAPAHDTTLYVPLPVALHRINRDSIPEVEHGQAYEVSWGTATHPSDLLNPADVACLDGRKRAEECLTSDALAAIGQAKASDYVLLTLESPNDGQSSGPDMYCKAPEISHLADSFTIPAEVLSRYRGTVYYRIARFNTASTTLKDAQVFVVGTSSGNPAESSFRVVSGN